MLVKYEHFFTYTLQRGTEQWKLYILYIAAG